MVILALDTATRAGSVALLVGEHCHVAVGESDRTHAERLPGELLALLARHGTNLAAVERLAVIAGPGSFTGLRVGMAAMQGLAIARGLEIVPIPTLEAMAQAVIWHTPPHTPITVVACLDGHRSEVFGEAWRVTPGALIADAEVVLPARVGPPEALAADVRRLASPVIAVLAGERSAAYGELLDPTVTRTTSPVPLADVAARLAALRPGRGVTPHALTPVYVRRPDAVLTRERSATGPPRA